MSPISFQHQRLLWNQPWSLSDHCLTCGLFLKGSVKDIHKKCKEKDNGDVAINKRVLFWQSFLVVFLPLVPVHHTCHLRSTSHLAKRYVSAWTNHWMRSVVGRSNLRWWSLVVCSRLVESMTEKWMGWGQIAWWEILNRINWTGKRSGLVCWIWGKGMIKRIYIPCFLFMIFSRTRSWWLLSQLTATLRSG